MENDQQLNTQQFTDNNDTSFHIKSVKFMCNSCNRAFYIAVPENGHGTCPRCDRVSDTIINDDNKDNRADNNEARAPESADSHIMEHTMEHTIEHPVEEPPQNQVQLPAPDQPHSEAPSRPQIRVIRIMRRIIFRPGGVIIIETVLPANPEDAEQIPNAQGEQNQENVNNAENQAQGQQGQEGHHRPFNPFEFLLQSLLDPSGLDRIIEEFIRNDPNIYGPPPASEENISKLEEFDYDAEKYKNSQCSVCQEEYTKEDKCLALPCKHDYHKNCITEWLKLHDSCPICRKPIAQSQPRAEKVNQMEEERPVEQAN